MNNEENTSFEELYNNSIKDVNLGKIVTGIIIDINSKNEIIVDLGYKADGIIPIQEYSFDESQNPRDEFKIGDKITADVLKLNDGVGNVLLSYKKYKSRNARKEFNEKVDNKEILQAKVSEVSDNGFVVSYEGIRVFIPISLSGISRDANIEDYKNKELSFRVIENDEKNRKVIGSVKEVIEEQKETKLKDFWNQAEIGKEYEGIVTSISSYGAFVDLGPVQGLLHISEMTWGRNVNPNEILEAGQKIKVKALDVDKENRRIKLTYENKGPNPWNDINSKYIVNDVVKVKVVKMMPFGAFVEVEKGIEGLVHISQITGKRIAKPEEALKIGQSVNAKIIELDVENQKMELSIRDLEGTSYEYKEEL